MDADRKLILYIAVSLDGYIAKPNDDLSFLSIVEKEGEDYGYADFVKTVDTVIMGQKTYDWVMNMVPEFPHADRRTYVITRTVRPNQGKVVFYTGNLVDLVKKLKSVPGKNIFCDGGAEIVNVLIMDALIDEMIISVIPVLVDNGKRLFAENGILQQLALVAVWSYDTGLVQLYYKWPFQQIVSVH
jgi:dihydrofolate reductase